MVPLPVGDSMTEVETVECQPVADKPLLPKWIAWTWPSGWFWWILWSLGLVALGWGLMVSIVEGGDGLIVGLGGAALGLFVMGWCVPNPFGLMMKNFQSGSIPGTWVSPPFPPMDRSDWHLDRVEWDAKSENWLPDPLAKFEHDGPPISVLEDGDDWVVFSGPEESGRFASPETANDHMIELIKEGDKINAQELLFGDHPRHDRYRALYNATPPQFTSRFFHHALSVFFMAGVFFGMSKGARESNLTLSIALLVASALATILSQFGYRRSMEAWDTVTSIIKFVDGGHGELVGQIRPLFPSPPKVLHVDGCRASAWTFENLAAWTWVYDATEKWTEKVYNHQTEKWETRHRRETRRIRWGNHASDFIVHDGTGGLVVKTSTFGRIDMGTPLWESSRHGGQGCGPLASPIRGGTISQHRWSLSAFRFSDPVYIMARIKSRPHDEVPKGTVAYNASRVHQTLEAVGEDAPRRDAKLCKGNELSVLSAKNSPASRLGPLILMIIVCALAASGL